MALATGKWWKRSRVQGRLRWGYDLDASILIPALLLTALGVAMVFSATHGRPDMARLYIKQIVWAAVGLGGMIFFSSLNYEAILDRWAYPFYFLMVLLLSVLLAAGEDIAGSRRWLALGPVAFQPSEFAKLATALVLTKFLSARQEHLHAWDTLLGAFLLAGLPMVLILKQPDLGTVVVFAVLLIVMLFTVGIPWRRLAVILGSGVLASPVVWLFLKDYQRRRLMVFFNPSVDTLGAGYNVIQSKIAIGSGLLLGKGWLMGTQGQLKFIPEHHTDFIFSVLAEEWGFIGCMVLILLYVVLLSQALRVARVARDFSGSLLAVGLSTILATQVIVNLGVTTGALPVTGLTLPLISYGGSSLVVTFCLLGMIMNIWSSRTVK